ncbi:hypothetical protein ACF3OB_02805 [Capnocytophaga canis]|uniref:hypothetical protein n=1 Tax=Capnocytophaga canis TaxID=1848903 RepID=UPI00370D00C0
MNKIIMEMQKVQNVGKIMFFILLLSISTSMFSQKTIEGIYSYVDGTGEFWARLELSKDGYFNYESGMDVGVSEYGKGHYILTKDSLILNYDLTEIKYAGYHILKPYLNLKDSIQIDVIVYDTDKNALPNTQVFIPKEIWAKTLTDNKGKALLNIKEEDAFNDLVIINNEYDAMYSIDNISLSFCYEIEVFLLNKIEGSGNAIKNTIQKYKIVKRKKNYLELQQPNGTILQFKKVEKGFYSDDPFE